MASLYFAADETRTFGLNIWRSDAGADIGLLLGTAPAADIVVLRDQVAQVQKNSIISNGAIDAALRDLILTFRKDLHDDNTMSATGVECQVVVAGAADAPAIQKICLENFSGYPGHYQLSPYLADATAAQGMLSWLDLLQQQDGEGVYVVRQGEKTMGVLGYSFEKQVAELAIAAISAEAGVRQRNLLLVEATRRVEQKLMQRGFKKFLAKTQATNLSIQRDLVRYVHCEPAATLATAHVHLFLGQIAKRGEDILSQDNLRETVMSYAVTVMNKAPLQKLHLYAPAGSRPVKYRALSMPRRDGARALFFAGYDDSDRVVAVASAFSS
ncbi:hypothetical protein [Turneriella parva]|uniref:Uncharacterized protein n=1 Tax=Turneriella parva (strain ATCC BAA-1111 / DSM 21527 / NCTC 11395 / H) TaxID=869212 RepID=I4B846_TURPD|nr:hypothetical protein [Turneriella parva]AFM13453.1 hypothetical protein Turpa_2814 [Turneriella parva DSM 21527]